MKTLYVSDLDGTLLNSSLRVSDASVQMINVLIGEGLPFTIATARSIESARELLSGIHLSLPAVFMNGVFITHPQTGETVREHFLPCSVGEAIVDAYLREGLKPVVYTIDGEDASRVYYRGVHNRSEELYIGDRLQTQSERFRITSDFTACLQEKLITVNAIDLPEKLEPVYKAFSEREDCICHYGPDVYCPGYYWLEISSAHATKSRAVLEVKERYGYNRVVVFGDNLNDLSMFEIADESYAVANAHELVKQAASRVIDSNDDDGVARFLAERKRNGK
ncbi:HAD family hydrolase [Paenibacillus sp. HB172176]|uniref:HAD family hydrolase n=1 Tax=Paenibacillus sp. HB172176 TaxID=2493690 RepID=UPI00143BFACC|nr:HAD family hydrolase [Paenibacillus sp. HB172176]